MKKLLRVVCIVIAMAFLIPSSGDLQLIKNEIVVKAQSNDSSATDSSSTDNSGDVKPAEDAKKSFTFPDQLRAATITPGKDFLKDPNQSAEVTQQEIDKIIANVNSYQMNAIIINTNYDNKAYFSSGAELNAQEQAIKTLINAAKKNLFFVYINLNMNFVLNQLDADAGLQTRVDYLTHIAHKFSREFFIDGIILDGYYSSKNISNYNSYVENGSGIGFENWLLENGAYVFGLVSEAIHKTDNTIPVGICISNAWANSSTNPDGSKTNDSFQALKDGYSDTVSYIKNGYADFIMLNAFGSIKDENLPFEAFVNWWSGQAVTSNIPLFVSHANEKMGTSAPGWSGEDQVVKQLLAIEKVKNYRGSAFNSYSALVANKGSTNALIKYYQKSLDVNSLDKELTINSPTKTVFTTYEPNMIFQGSFDSNFDVNFNGQPIKLNEAGNFYYNVQLDVGLNTFTISNKGKVITYKITRKVKVLQSIEPKAGTLNVDGETIISVSAIAYKGSNVTATFNGKTITLKEADGPVEGMDPNSNYTQFSGSFQAPKGNISKEQNLGAIVIKGNYKNITSESSTGATVIVNKLPEGTLPQTLIRITNPNGALIYNINSTYEYQIPMTRMPVGTYDYLLSTMTYNGKTYYKTQSGRRILASDATIEDGYTFANNTIQFIGSSVNNYDTILQFKLNKKSPFEIASSPCNYYSGRRGDYYVNYNANSIVITFDYLANVANNVSLPGGSLFSSASWSSSTDKNGRPQQKLTLTLNKTGGYSGVAPSYSDDGTLTLRFNGHPSSLQGATIVIDPGHGFTKPGVNDPGAIGQVVERDVNLAVAKLVEQKLKASGANVYRMNTESSLFDTLQRANIATQYKPDIFLSIHCNSAASPAYGSEAYYFQPFSQPLANYLSANVGSYVKNNISSKGYDRGEEYNEFAVTLQQQFASSLVELEFVNNEYAVYLMNPTYQDGIANAIVNSFAQYLANN